MTYIVYHKNCMDGVSSAFIADYSIKDDKILVPLNYTEDRKLFFYKPTKEDTVYFVDFSFKRENTIKLANLVKNIIILDHHKTAEAELIDLPENVEVNFDMNESGATLSYKYFYGGQHLGIPYLLEYIKDRDLWKWELPNSKEVSEYLAFKVIPNDITSFGKVFKEDINDMIHLGKILLEKKQQQIDSKLAKVQDLKVNDVWFKAINVTENISELGNEICAKYNKPALLYFITENNEVICSLRSTDELDDVSEVAKSFGGGGHRNAAGFKLTLEDFVTILKN